MDAVDREHRARPGRHPRRHQDLDPVDSSTGRLRIGPGSIILTRNAAQPAGGSSQQAQAGRSPVLDAAQLEVLHRYGREHDVAAGDVLFADGDVTYDLIV